MDVTQINIKINQNNQSSGGKAKADTQTDTPVTSFDQILAMFNVAGQLSQQGQPSLANSLKNASASSNNGKVDDKTISAEDWSQLASILSAWISGGVQQGTAATGTQSVNLKTGSELSGNSLQPVPDDIKKALTQWLEKATGKQLFNQDTDASSLIQQLTQLIGDIQSQQGQVPMDVFNKLDQLQPGKQQSNENTDASSLIQQPTQLIGDISQQGQVPMDVFNKLDQLQQGKQPAQVLMGDLNEVNQPQQAQPPSDVLNQLNPAQQTQQIPTDFLNKMEQLIGSLNPQGGKTIQFNLLKSTDSISAESKSPLSLDKNQVMFPVLSVTQLPSGMNATSTESTVPVLPVNQVVPEIIELAGGLIKLNGGQAASAEARFNLFPKHLGPVEIKITSKDGQVSAQIVTNTQDAKNVLEGQVQSLKEALQQQGLFVQKLDIVQQPSSSPALDVNQASFSFSQGGNSNFANRQQTNTAEEETSKKKMADDSMEMETEVLPITYGTATTKKTTGIDFTA